MKIQLTLTHENIKGVFCLENSQITFAQDGTYWYAESDDIAGYGMDFIFCNHCRFCRRVCAFFDSHKEPTEEI